MVKVGLVVNRKGYLVIRLWLGNAVDAFSEVASKFTCLLIIANEVGLALHEL